MAKFHTFKGSWPWPWIGSYCIPSCITHRPLHIYQISLKSKKLFVDRWTDGHLRPTLLCRLGGVDIINRNTNWMFKSSASNVWKSCSVNQIGRFRLRWIIRTGYFWWWWRHRVDHCCHHHTPWWCWTDCNTTELTGGTAQPRPVHNTTSSSVI